jgi:hypothetical protein
VKQFQVVKQLINDPGSDLMVCATGAAADHSGRRPLNSPSVCAPERLLSGASRTLVLSAVAHRRRMRAPLEFRKTGVLARARLAVKLAAP